MTLENQVCSLELAKRLKELSVKQESCFWWCDPSDGDKADVGFIRDNHVGYKVFYSAFTVAELGEMLSWIEIKRKRYIPITYQFVGKEGFKCDLIEERMKEIFTAAVAVTEADARAKMLIYLLENKLIAL